MSEFIGVAIGAFLLSTVAVLLTVAMYHLLVGRQIAAHFGLHKCTGGCESLISNTQKMCTDCFIATHTERTIAHQPEGRVVVAICAKEAESVAKEAFIQKR